MAALLHRMAARADAPPYAARLLAACSGELPQTPPRGLPSLVEPLTPRELEVMHLIALGRSNAEIAESLVIALPTVKRHISNIFGKLAVTARAQAAARARELGLV
jgi:LuxR family maltose regulon positive regulatory protein